MKTLNKMGQEFCDRSGFCQQNRSYGLRRVQDELNEAFNEAFAHNDIRMVAEMADVVLTLAALAQAWGLDLDAAVQAKHEINMIRKWGPHPTIPGAVKHIKKGADSV